MAAHICLVLLREIVFVEVFVFLKESKATDLVRIHEALDLLNGDVRSGDAEQVGHARLQTGEHALASRGA